MLVATLLLLVDGSQSVVGRHDVQMFDQSINKLNESSITEDMKERIFGKEIDLCKNYNFGSKSPLHLSHPTDCGTME